MHFFFVLYFVNARAYVWLIGVRPTYTLVYNLHVVELIFLDYGIPKHWHSWLALPPLASGATGQNALPSNKPNQPTIKQAQPANH